MTRATGYSVEELSRVTLVKKSSLLLLLLLLMTSKNLRNERPYMFILYRIALFPCRNEKLSGIVGIPIRYVTLHLTDRRIFAPL